jgi:hypothetical protein
MRGQLIPSFYGGSPYSLLTIALKNSSVNKTPEITLFSTLSMGSLELLYHGTKIQREYHTISSVEPREKVQQTNVRTLTFTLYIHCTSNVAYAFSGVFCTSLTAQHSILLPWSSFVGTMVT